MRVTDGSVIHAQKLTLGTRHQAAGIAKAVCEQL